MLSPEAEKEFRAMARSESLRSDMDAVRRNRRNPFLKNGVADADAYIAFVTIFNEFINHEPKSFKPMVGDHMRL
jgi:hypothetical protein